MTIAVGAETLKEELEIRTGEQLELRINDNRSTMLSVQEECSLVRISLHQMFLKAPENVVQALAGFIKGENRRCGSATIQAYIEENLPKLNYSKRLDKSKLITKGKVFDLKKIYQTINERYFDSQLDLQITWYGRHKNKPRNSVTFGLYLEQLRLVKVHCLLDDPKVPDYFIGYVVYHEMLHHVCPIYVGEDGRRQVHSKEFKELEKRYHDFEKAQKWLKKSREKLFSGKL